MPDLGTADLGRYVHHRTAHCETGTVAALCRCSGLPLSEPMAFAVGSGLFFAHIPPVKVMDLELTSFRAAPSSVGKKVFRRLGMGLVRRRFAGPAAGEAALDRLLADGRAVGVQVSVMDLPYLPRRFRFPFNAHHVMVLRREGDRYLVADPVLEEPQWCPVADFTAARFAEGPLAPHGLVYAPARAAPAELPRAAVIAGLRETARRMIHAPGPWFGVKGIRGLARRVELLAAKPAGERRYRLQLAQIVRMSEEIGSGGAGFRFLYGASLEEAGAWLGCEALAACARDMSACGDLWRDWAAQAVRVCRRDGPVLPADGTALKETMLGIADAEERVYRAMDAALAGLR